MGYWISLDFNDEIVKVDRHSEGGTYALGGTDEASISVTYNYAKFFQFRDLHGVRAGDTIETLQTKVAELGTKIHHDYWEPTPGNVGYTLSVLLEWAMQHPDAVWDVR